MSEHAIGDIVMVTGYVDNKTNYAHTVEPNAITSDKYRADNRDARVLHRMTFAEPKKGIVLGWTHRFLGTVSYGFSGGYYSDGQDEPPHLVVEGSVRVWVVQLLNGTNRYGKSIAVEDSQIVAGAEQ